MINYIDGHLFREMIISGASKLDKDKDRIDALNVFPVPDGDTGINMSLTLLSAAKEVGAAKSDRVCDVAEAVAKGALKGARGNSGVILSQLMRGFSRGCEGKDKLTLKEFAACLKSGSDMAYKAVMKPREGTMLTVARVIAQDMEALLAKEPDIDLFEFFEQLIESGTDILKKTPDLLPVLKKAGVVDAGGVGLLTIYAGYKAAALGNGEGVDLSFALNQVAGDVSGSEDLEEESIEFAYCTELFIKNCRDGVADKEIDSFRTRLGKLGDCVLVVGDAELLKVHVHTNNPGKVLEMAVKLGMLSNIKIDNMREQHRTIIEEAAELNLKPKKPSAMIAVAVGSGIEEVFRDLSVDRIISGGQTMNPSTQDFLDAIKAVNAEETFIFPNNPNIILAAQQAAELCEGTSIHVLPTRTIAQGIACAIAYFDGQSPKENVARMNEAIKGVLTGEITYAVRDTTVNDKDIKKGDILGIIEGDIACTGKKDDEVMLDMLGKMVNDDHSVITLFYGKSVKEKDAGKLAKRIEEKYGDLSVELAYGGQPLYSYLFSVE